MSYAPAPFTRFETVPVPCTVFSPGVWVVACTDDRQHWRITFDDDYRYRCVRWAVEDHEKRKFEYRGEWRVGTIDYYGTVLTLKEQVRINDGPWRYGGTHWVDLPDVGPRSKCSYYVRPVKYERRRVR